MAGSTSIVFLSLALSLFVHATIGKPTRIREFDTAVACERLGADSCSFAVSSAGTRCVLEKFARRGGQMRFACCSSDIEAESGLANWVESDECVDACGLDRNAVGISSDGLLDGEFTKRLCSPRCYENCPNIIDLYFNLAVGEGVFLPKMCEDKVMAEIRSSGAATVTDDESSTKDVTEVRSSDP